MPHGPFLGDDGLGNCGSMMHSKMVWIDIFIMLRWFWYLLRLLNWKQIRPNLGKLEQTKTLPFGKAMRALEELMANWAPWVLTKYWIWLFFNSFWKCRWSLFEDPLNGWLRSYHKDFVDALNEWWVDVYFSTNLIDLNRWIVPPYTHFFLSSLYIHQKMLKIQSLKLSYR